MEDQQQSTLNSETREQQQGTLISETRQQQLQGTINSETQQKQQQGIVNSETHGETDWSSTSNMQEKKRLDIPVEKKNLVAHYLLLNSSGLVSLSQLVCSNSSPNMKFQTMHNVVHIDEKWFFMTKTEHRYYLLPTEEEPYRCCKSKRFISKVMFMCVVARPQFSLEGQCLFDGKIDIFPFTTLEPAMRNSKNRVKGTLETKPLHSVTKQVINDCIINEVIPTIKTKWPTNGTKEILIQQDNAKPYIKHDDIDFMAAANFEGFNIKLICQPANSPDTNVNDLEFFRAIQSLQTNKFAANVDDLLQNVKSSFEELSAQTLNNVFLTLQMCLIEIMKVRGGNNYKIPHMNKQRLIALGKLPDSIEVERSIVKDCLRFLSLLENDAGSSYDIEALIRATKE